MGFYLFVVKALGFAPSAKCQLFLVSIVIVIEDYVGIPNGSIAGIFMILFSYQRFGCGCDLYGVSEVDPDVPRGPTSLTEYATNQVEIRNLALIAIG